MLNYKECKLCQRLCGVNREAGEVGFCKMPSEMRISKAYLHRWEEPPISGERGSGTIFFTGCSLGCIYCQNRDISRSARGISVSCERLSEIMLSLEEKGAHNINLVTPTHYAPSIKETVRLARARGLKIPIVYNTGAYDTEDTVSELADTIDIWLPDLKYYRERTAAELSLSGDLPQKSRLAIEKMVEASGECRFDERGIMQKGVIVRILLLPSHVAEAKLNLKYLAERFGNKIYISLMSQYTPPEGMKPPLNRRVSRAEYEQLVDYARTLGLSQVFVQERESATDSYIPSFDGEGVI